MSLPWGRRYLMCPPVHFGVLYEINAWMDKEVTVDVDRAQAQWEALGAVLRSAGAEVLHEARVWPEYHPNYYGAFVRDPDGNNVEAVCHAPEG